MCCPKHEKWDEHTRCLCLCHDHNSHLNRNWAHAGDWLRPSSMGR